MDYPDCRPTGNEALLVSYVKRHQLDQCLYISACATTRANDIFQQNTWMHAFLVYFNKILACMHTKVLWI